MRGLETTFVLLPFPLSLFYLNYFDRLSGRRFKKNPKFIYLFIFTQQILTTVKLWPVVLEPRSEDRFPCPGSWALQASAAHSFGKGPGLNGPLGCLLNKSQAQGLLSSERKQEQHWGHCYPRGMSGASTHWLSFIDFGPSVTCWSFS